MNSILKETINIMKETVGKINLSNIEETKIELEKYFVLIETISSIESDKEPTKPIIEEEEEVRKSPVEPIFKIRHKGPVVEKEDSIVFTREEEEEPALDYSYPFERKLSGGFLRTGNSETDIFVPEKYVRDLDIQEGDLVFADELGSSSYGKVNYRYEVVEESKEPTENESRKEFAFAIVEKEETTGQFVIYENIHKEKLRNKDGDMTSYILNDKEIEHFSIYEGSIVDLAWYSGAFSTARVVWHYHISDVEEEKETESKRMLNHNKNNSTSTKTEKVAVEQTLKDKRICLIGLDPYWAKYRDIIEERGGELDTVESNRHKTSMTASIRKSDLVVAGISHTSHAASQYANKRAKVYGIPFTSISGYGGETFLNAVLEHVQ